MTFRLFLIFFGLVLGFSSCRSGSEKDKGKKEIILFAAASVTDVMQEIACVYQEETGVKVKLNLASSGILARQIEQGARCDVYISANENWMDYVQEKQFISKESRRIIARNRLVAIVPKNSKLNDFQISDQLNFPDLFSGRLSLGDPIHVPAGKYALEVLKYYQWDAVLKERLLPAKDVRDALMMVELGEAEMGIVYASDAQKSGKVRVVAEFPSAACSSITYHAALTSEASLEAGEFFKYLMGDEAQRIWAKNGFNKKNE